MNTFEIFYGACASPTIGKHIDLLKCTDFTAACLAIQAEHPEFEEWEIVDHDGDYAINLDECARFIEHVAADIEPEVILAFASCFGYIPEDGDDITDSYQGEYSDDKDFAEQIGAINNDLNWPHTCIDWDFAAKELMYDYTSHNGHYFRLF